MTATRPIRDEDLMALPRDANKYEVVGGELRVMSPAGPWHELVIMALAERLSAQVRKHRLGRVFGSNVMYAMPGGNRRSPTSATSARSDSRKDGVAESSSGVGPSWR